MIKFYQITSKKRKCNYPFSATERPLKIRLSCDPNLPLEESLQNCILIDQKCLCAAPALLAQVCAFFAVCLFLACRCTTQWNNKTKTKQTAKPSQTKPKNTKEENFTKSLFLSRKNMHYRFWKYCPREWKWPNVCLDFWCKEMFSSSSLFYSLQSFNTVVNAFSQLQGKQHVKY